MIDQGLRGPLLDENFLSELLCGSEDNFMRLTKQAKLLKYSRRRAGKKLRREGVCQLGIPKNIILQFLKRRLIERDHLVLVFSSMLKLSQEEKNLVIQQARGDAANEENEEGGGWRSYVYCSSWKSFT
ncbi:uncharacterized protein LOC114953990 isoform X2 [Acropora millepora]|uniref:uncharacterized protein LOC114953990 isoform X1 n=1 Tax=Acropora millepora TaxID=45264 RepID=UPI001CF4B05D|nr:uncharacterized protein LOC114953990 isoform X1 [Acropora millepora]XP_044180392.1 uncharacterized protein LOC114953990 isoform X1 [Acropora millepora]XP_044180393.1 uncharacterized protein LOC114953990 isoform X1 [Acropora millepora]XP_044180394.1 uncharacterized protein LOC114953990 isoform X2 [Acropora millepora]